MLVLTIPAYSRNMQGCLLIQMQPMLLNGTVMCCRITDSNLKLGPEWVAWAFGPDRGVGGSP